jgi:hypothetical protein
MPISQKGHDDCLLYARDTKEIESFVKTLHDDYKLTLNDSDPIDDFLEIHVSHQDNGELHMSQPGLIDAVIESAHFLKGRHNYLRNLKLYMKRQ